MNARSRLFLLLAMPACGSVIAEPTRPDASVSDSATPPPVGDAATADSDAAVCASGKPSRECFDEASMKAMFAPGRGGDVGGDAAVVIPPDAYDPSGCVAMKYAQNGCCNPAVTPGERVGDKCCYTFCTGSCCGRPLYVGGEARVAPLVARRDWCGRCGPGLALSREPGDPSLREALARGFAADALMEHASIASFSRFALELLAFGAPPALVRDAHEAALDEVEHARVTFALASRFAAGPVGPGRLDVAGVTPAATLEAAVVAAVREGCVGETIAAILAEEAAAVAVDPECRDALEAIAADEARHAELAWRFVAWALDEDAQLGGAIERAFEDALAHDLPGLDGCDDPRVRHYGRLTAGDRARLAASVASGVIGPCAARLLDTAGRQSAVAA